MHNLRKRSSLTFYLFAFLLLWFINFQCATALDGNPTHDYSTTTVNTTKSSVTALDIQVFMGQDEFFGETQKEFRAGEALFDKFWELPSSSANPFDGLGPLYNARSCRQCHINNGRGRPPSDHYDRSISYVFHLSGINEGYSHKSTRQSIDTYSSADDYFGWQLQSLAVPGVVAEGKASVRYINIEIELSGADNITLRVPQPEIIDSDYGVKSSQLRISPRIAPPIIGLGLLEAIAEEDLIQLADPDDQDGDGISGRLHYVENQQPGRFGWKATESSLNRQVQTALLRDLGLSTPNHPQPWGDCTKQQVQCRNSLQGDKHTNGIEVEQEIIDLMVTYLKNVAVPNRKQEDHPDLTIGRQLFHQAGCAACHIPKFTIASELSNNGTREIWPYTDLLLHDMGEALADFRAVGDATGYEWRTPPLWGIGLSSTVNGNAYYLHDGRARSILEAILWHGGEAAASREYVRLMLPVQRQQLIGFIKSL